MRAWNCLLHLVAFTDCNGFLTVSFSYGLFAFFLQTKKEALASGTEPELKVRGAALLLVVCSNFDFRLRCYLVA